MWYSTFCKLTTETKEEEGREISNVINNSTFVGRTFLEQFISVLQIERAEKKIIADPQK